LDLADAVFDSLTAPLLARCTFPQRGSDLSCAVSGGADSLALLVLGVASGCEVTAYHVDHGLRPGSASEAEVVHRAAEALGARFVSLGVTVAHGPNLEARARELRYGVLPSAIATGHTADDQAETVLINLLRGAGIDGLAGMRRGWRHPLLGLRRSETRALVGSLGLEVVADPTNEEPSNLRNRIRLHLLPELVTLARRDLVPVLGRQAELLADEADLLDELSRPLDPTDARALCHAPPPLARRAVRRWLRSEGGYPPPRAAIERVLRVAAGEVVGCETGDGVSVRRSHGRLVLSRPEPRGSDGDSC
jgi:tRNA(Ile)-lysidine synthase